MTAPGKPKYPFQSMRVGESFVVIGGTKCFQNNVAKKGRKLGRKFETSRVGEVVYVTRVG